jgi:hypothetical protein
VLAYKFLRHDRRGVHTGWQWPLDEWVDSADVDPCRVGIHACEADDVAWWLADELWLIELDGSVTRARHKVVARRGRLVRTLDEYPAAVRELGRLATQRTRNRAIEALGTHHRSEIARQLSSVASLADWRALGTLLADQLDDSDPVMSLALLSIDTAIYAADGEPPEAPFIACCAAGVEGTLVDSTRAAYEEAFGAERRWQADWLARRLALR